MEMSPWRVHRANAEALLRCVFHERDRTVACDPAVFSPPYAAHRPRPRLKSDRQGHRMRSAGSNWRAVHTATHKSGTTPTGLPSKAPAPAVAPHQATLRHRVSRRVPPPHLVPGWGIAAGPATTTGTSSAAFSTASTILNLLLPLCSITPRARPEPFVQRLGILPLNRAGTLTPSTRSPLVAPWNTTPAAPYIGRAARIHSPYLVQQLCTELVNATAVPVAQRPLSPHLPHAMAARRHTYLPRAPRPQPLPHIKAAYALCPICPMPLPASQCAKAVRQKRSSEPGNGAVPRAHELSESGHVAQQRVHTWRLPQLGCPPARPSSVLHTKAALQGHIGTSAQEPSAMWKILPLPPAATALISSTAVHDGAVLQVSALPEERGAFRTDAAWSAQRLALSCRSPCTLQHAIPSTPCPTEEWSLFETNDVNAGESGLILTLCIGATCNSTVHVPYQQAASELLAETRIQRPLTTALVLSHASENSAPIFMTWVEQMQPSQPRVLPPVPTLTLLGLVAGMRAHEGTSHLGLASLPQAIRSGCQATSAPVRTQQSCTHSEEELLVLPLRVGLHGSVSARGTLQLLQKPGALAGTGVGYGVVAAGAEAAAPGEQPPRAVMEALLRWVRGELSGYVWLPKKAVVSSLDAALLRRWGELAVCPVT
jgi:hypothetical protein